MDKVWKDIEGYEGLYQVSNTGQVKSLNYKGHGVVRLLKQDVIHNGYKRVSLFKNGKKKNYLVHRLVAITFLPNPHGYKEINHIDENKANNMISNLEWCSREYNMNYGTVIKRSSEKRKGKDNPNAKTILMYDKEGNFIRKFDSIADANKYFGKDRNCSQISRCLRGRNKTAYDHIFVYTDDNQDTLRKKINEVNNNKSGEAHKKPISMFDKEGNFIRYFECVKDTDEFFGKKDASSAVSACLTGRRKTAYGYVFKYADEDYYIKNK